MKKVKRDKYAINRGKCGSFFIYSNEYTCTKKEIILTTNNIAVLKRSNKKLQETLKFPEIIQVPKSIKETIGLFCKRFQNQ